MRARRTFGAWLAEVDRMLWTRFGLPSHRDLADQPWLRWYEERVAPLTAAGRAWRAEGGAAGWGRAA